MYARLFENVFFVHRSLLAPQPGDASPDRVDGRWMHSHGADGERPCRVDSASGARSRRRGGADGPEMARPFAGPSRGGPNAQAPAITLTVAVNH